VRQTQAMKHAPVRLAIVAVLAISLALVPGGRHVATAADSAGLIGPKPYYLALGDSLTFGIQPTLNSHAGYVDDFFANLQPHGVQTVANLGCNGETTITFINGGCKYATVFPPHYHYAGSQLAAALDFIRSHPGQVSPVTIDVGADDFNIDPQTCVVSAMTQTLQTFEVNYRSILGQLKAALKDANGNDTGDLVTMTYYFPYQNTCPALTPLFSLFNADLASIARQSGALVAPVYATFGGPTTPNPNLCSLTWVCQTNTFITCKVSAILCIHPNTLGYRLMAATVEYTTGY